MNSIAHSPYNKQNAAHELLTTTKNELNYIIACILQINTKTASDYSTRVAKAIASKMTGVGAATGFLGMVSTFGTAGTGTAIASLSGAAATNATLAWVGGILGGGMAAGALMTGGLAVVVGVGAYKLFGSTPREYDDLNNIEQRVISTCVILIRAIDDHFSKQQFPGVSELKLVHQHSIKPLYQLINTHKDDICVRLDLKNQLAFSCHAIPDFKRNVLNRFAVL